MKNLRIAKKNPSKILKILQMPLSYRYNHPQQQLSTQIITQQMSINKSKSKQSKNIHNSINKQQSLRHSPSRSQRAIELRSLNKDKKLRNRSLGNSQEAINKYEMKPLTLNFRHSIQFRAKQDNSPYTRRNKFRESEKFLNFHSVSLGDKNRKQQRDIKEESKNNSRKRNSNIKPMHSQQEQTESKMQEKAIQNAKALLSQGQYRKSLLVVRSVLKIMPDHSQALYLSALNWYHLEDHPKAVLNLDQILYQNPSFSAECYKIIAVCYFKSLQYIKSLNYLQNCHKYFPEQPESYELEGKILSKMQKWKEALQCYRKCYQLSKNSDYLIDIANCYEELKQFQQAIECFNKALKDHDYPLKIYWRKLKLQCDLEQYQQIINLYESFQKKWLHIEPSKQKEQIYYLISYSYYKIKLFSKCRTLIEESLKTSLHPFRFNRLLLILKIEERDIYQAFHLTSRMKEDPQLKIYVKFIEGVIGLMRRNYNEGIHILLTLQSQLGFNLQMPSRLSNNSEDDISIVNWQIQDILLNQIRKIYLMFLSYGYFCISQFYSCKRLMILQKEIGVPEYFKLGLAYNIEMCEGIIHHCDKRFAQAEKHFQTAYALFDNKLQPSFSLALNYLQLMTNAKSREEKDKMIMKAKQEFVFCQKFVGKASNNTSASVFYFSSLLYAYIQEWKQALNCIDQSIERSEDHYWRYFYVRGLLLSCIHSFHEAINDLGIAVNLSGSSRPECYLLRSKCLQIEGQGNEAFKDLQQYITLKPDDPDVHKYAGQLLFQNGAFEDALVAFSHQPIKLIPQNYDILLTQGKSEFLLGRFRDAFESISKCNVLRPQQQVQFDLCILSILDIMTSKTIPDSQVHNKLDQTYSKFKKYGRIFKLTDYHVFKGVIYMRQHNFKLAARQFSLAIKQKYSELGKGEVEDDLNLQQNTKQCETFSNQMRYNLCLCQIGQNNFIQALDICKKINIQLDQPYYSDYVNFRKFISRQHQTYKKDQVFPNKNKLSNFLDKAKLEIKNKNQTESMMIILKLCIPFPKVEPPEIFPSFDEDLLTKLSVLNVQRKPEAPWIIRENNSIKFTDKIQTYSKFELQDSQNQSTSTYQIISIDQSHINRQSRSKQIGASALIIASSKKSNISEVIELN